MENCYAKSPMIGRKSKGTFCGLRFKNKSKDYTIQIIAVCWQTWAVDIYDDTNGLVVRTMLHQVGENLPTFEIKNSRAYRRGFHYKTTGCEIYSA